MAWIASLTIPPTDILIPKLHHHSPFTFTPTQRHTLFHALLPTTHTATHKTLLTLPLPALPLSLLPPTTQEKEEEEEKEVSSWTLLWHLVAPDKWLVATAVVTTIGSSLVSLFIPPAVASLLGAVRSGSSVLSHALSLAGIVATQAVLSASYIALLASLSHGLVARLRSDIFGALLGADMGVFDSVRGGAFSALLSADVEAVRSCVKHLISVGVKSVVVLVGGFVSLALLSPHMTLILGTALPVSVYGGSLFASHLRSLSARASRKGADSLALAAEYLANIRTVRAFVGEAAALSRFRAATEEATGLSASLGHQIGVFHGVTVAGLYSLVVGVMLYGASLVATGAMDPDSIVTFMLQASRMQSAFASLSILSGQIVKGGDAAARIAAVTSKAPQIPLKDPHPRAELPGVMEGSISFANVSFTYPSRPHSRVLESLSLDIPAGSVVALVGPSGSGKSTLTSLLLRMYDPDAGCVTVDGIDLRELDPEALRTRMAIVSQEPDLFAGTIGYNIGLGKPGASLEEIRAAARVAAADEFISAFPSGYDTLVGERGVQLSGGQKQRLAIARAVLRDPDILIMDEAYSALDLESEAAVQRAMDQLISNTKTVIVIAHRLSTVVNADVIAVVVGGRVVEQGTHHQLLEESGSVYSGLWASQFGTQ